MRISRQRYRPLNTTARKLGYVKPPPPPDLRFIFTVRVTAGQSFTLPTVSDGSYDAKISWGDGQEDDLTVWNAAERTHTYVNAGDYDIVISGTEFRGWRVNNYADRLKIIEIKNWGILKQWTYYGFFGCSNLVITATDIPDLSDDTSMAYCFRDCTNLSSIPNVNDWDVSTITALGLVNANSGCFYNSAFNSPIHDWDVSNVTNFTGVFGNSPFNQNINSWDVSSGERFSYMFENNTAFSYDLNGWDVSSGQLFNNMFRNSNYNGNIDDWNVAESRTFTAMFQNNSAFSQDLSSWPVTSHIDDNSQKFRAMFGNAVSVNFSPASWDVESMVDAWNMFQNVTLSTSNYDATLISWANQQVQNGVAVNFGTSKYTAGGAAEAARNVLINTYGWTISDGGAV